MKPPNEPTTRIGISGWTYPPWRKVFYPPRLSQSRELAFASRVFPSIEINGSFYSLMRPETYRAWYEQTPEGFVFAVKGGRYITHMLRLRNVETALANFFASGVLCLAEKLGPFLWQLPPTMAFSPEILRAFLELLPRTTREMERLARAHDQRLIGRAVVEAHADVPVRHTLEVRHPTFADPRYIELLRQLGVASCVADSAGLYPLIEDLTSDFAYARLHGSTRLYVSGYSRRDLEPWAQRARAWRAGLDAPGATLIGPPRSAKQRKPLDVFMYFDNDVKVRAPFDAQNLARLIAGEPELQLPDSLSGVTEEPRQTWRKRA